MLVLAAFMLLTVIPHMRKRLNRLGERESDRMIAIAIKTTSLLRQGLTEETAMEACTIILDELPSINAVALTNAKRVLGYAGSGCIDHQQWRHIKSVHTKECLRTKIPQVVPSVGCIDSCCPLSSAIIVPLLLRDQAVGTVKFYYPDVVDLSEDELAMTESLAGLISVQLEVHDLEKEAAFVREMELKMLQAQIDPHFLFNTLNTIASLTRTNPQTARDLISNLAQFYRYTLEGGTEEETLRDSVDMVLHYFDLEKARFGERLHLNLDIDDFLLDLRMPRFMLQPLVENSIKHGMRPDGSRLTIWVQAELIESSRNPHILISVIDDGQGIQSKRVESIFLEGKSETGLGLALRNVRGQLKHYYGLTAEMEFLSSEGEGTEVTYRIPYDAMDEID
jgi:LytS/YehU family sensor histidine kinase